MTADLDAQPRKVALALILHQDAFLVVEIKDPKTGAVFHRPPGGGMEEGEDPEQTLRRELHEELGVHLTTAQEVGVVDHFWSWDGRERHERIWLFLVSSSTDERLSRAETPELLEADGQRFKTIWRPIRDAEGYPPLCPPSLLDFLA